MKVVIQSYHSMMYKIVILKTIGYMWKYKDMESKSMKLTLGDIFFY